MYVIHASMSDYTWCPVIDHLTWVPANHFKVAHHIALAVVHMNSLRLTSANCWMLMINNKGHRAPKVGGIVLIDSNIPRVMLVNYQLLYVPFQDVEFSNMILMSLIRCICLTTHVSSICSPPSPSTVWCHSELPQGHSNSKEDDWQRILCLWCSYKVCGPWSWYCNVRDVNNSSDAFRFKV